MIIVLSQSIFEFRFGSNFDEGIRRIAYGRWIFLIAEAKRNLIFTEWRSIEERQSAFAAWRMRR
jgi:hypothetical protein